ncbi:MAG TPA: hypothetical protein VI796_03680 [Candidatus Thermoplasmatota archaeon]|nr:hypothetical protein [Candidatus Thermoplasmatota archaeon]
MARIAPLLTALATLALALSGCSGGDDDSDPLPTDMPMNMDLQTHFEFGPSVGCLGTELATGGLNCVSFTQGPAMMPVDGFWLELDANYAGLDFTSTVGNELGDSDCWFVGDDATTILADAHNGAAVCSGTVPDEAAWLFIYSYAAPSTAITVDFTLPDMMSGA